MASFLRMYKNGQVPRLILGYVLADSGGTAIIIREFVPIFTKEGRNFFAQISSIMYSFVESLVHSELKHVETENIHLYFARLGDFILVLFSDVEDDKVAGLAGNIVKLISELGYDAFTIQLDDDIREEVIGIIEKNIITVPPNINFIRKIITMITPILSKEKNVKLNLTPVERKTLPWEEFLKRRKSMKIRKIDQETSLEMLLNANFSQALNVASQLIESRIDDSICAIFAKSAILQRLASLSEDIIPLDQVMDTVSKISHPILREFLKTEINSFKDIRAGIERKLYFLKHRRMFFTKILTETKDSLLYATISFPPTDTETAKVLRDRFGDDCFIFKAYCEDFLYSYRTLLMKETSQETWLITMGEIYDRMIRLLDKNKVAALTYLRSYIVNTLASIIQTELKVDEVENVLDTFITNWKGWEKELKSVKNMWQDVKASIYAYYLETTRWYLRLKGRSLKKDFLRDLEKKATEYLRYILTLVNNDAVPLSQIYTALSTIILVLSEILMLSNKYSEDLIQVISNLLKDDLTIIWSENPAEYAVIYRNFLKALANMAKQVKLESVKKSILLDVGKELLSLAEAFEKLPMIYWTTLVDSIEVLANSDESGVNLAKTVIAENEKDAPPSIRHVLKLIMEK